MAGGPRPQPTTLRLLRGNPGKRKLNRDEPQPEIPPAVPDPPPHLLPLARDEWWRCGADRRRCSLGNSAVVSNMPFSPSSRAERPHEAGAGMPR
jgi:hypothetical protein